MERKEFKIEFTKDGVNSTAWVCKSHLVNFIDSLCVDGCTITGVMKWGDK